MGAMTDYLENKTLDFLLRGQAFSPPATTYLALFTAAPSDAGGGTEVSGGTYSRVAIPCSTTDWAGTQAPASTTASSGSTGTTSNNNVLNFPTPTANWGTVTHVGLYDASTGGNLLWYGALSASQVVNTGNTVSFAAASLTIQLDN